MHSAMGLFASFFVNAIWQVTFIAGTGWLAARVLRRLGPRVEHWTFVFTLMAAACAPVLLPLRELLAVLFVRSSDGPRLTITAMAAENVLPDAHSIHVIPAALLWPLLSIYLGSIVYFAIRLSRSLYFAHKLLRETDPITLTHEQKDLLDRCKQSFAVNAIRMESSRKIAGPAALGLRNPVLVFPDDFIARCESRDLSAAFAHECAHIQRNDFAKNLAYEAVSLIVVFHPAVWFIKSQITQTREMVCDAMVAETFNEPRNYAHSLLRLAELVAASHVPASLAIGIFDANILEKRIMTIRAKKLPSSVFVRSSRILLAVLLLCGMTAGSAAMAVAIEEQAPPQNAVLGGPYGPVYKIGKDVSAPVPLHIVEADFPKSAHDTKVGFHAIVLVGLTVDAGGIPRDVHVFRSYNADFDAEAIKAVQLYRFKPAMRAGKPVAVSLSIEVDFQKY
jgi:TonB family protein